MKRSPHPTFLAFGFTLLSAVITGRSDTLNLPVAADTFINSRPEFIGNSAGGNAWFDVGSDRLGGVRRGLIRFDLSGVPTGAVVTSAVVQVTVTKAALGANAAVLDLWQLNAAWGEGTNSGPNGAPATTGDANWNARQFGTASWTTPGALNDIVAGNPTASTTVNPVAGSVSSWNSAGLVADVQHWLDQPASNFGWLIVSESESSFSSVIALNARENPAGGPLLQLGYTPASGPNLPPVVAIDTPTNGASFSAPASVIVQASAHDPDGTVTNVQFFDGSTLLGNATANPFSVTVDLSPGTHTLTAMATDNLGATTTSAGVSVTVNNVVISNPIAARIPKGTVTVDLQTVLDGLASPLGMAVPDDGSGRMFVYDQDGHVYLLQGSTRLPTPLLDVSSRLVRLAAYDERGLLGLAVHQDFAQHPLLYTYTSEPVSAQADFQTGVVNDHQSVIAEWRISTTDSNVVDLTSRRELMRIDEPQSNHNSGAMHFGPDGLLYVTLGDGGAANDTGSGHGPNGNAQDVTSILGKMIRIDVDGRNSANGQYGIPAGNPFVGGNGLPEVYALGLRNPFCFSFDWITTNLWLADVGQNKVEEVDLIRAGGNYGWNLQEGGFWFDPASGNDVTAPVRQPPPDLVDPVAQYDHDDGQAIIGGYVYRGTAIPTLAGRYVFGDWGSFGAPSGRLFYLDETNGVNEVRIGADDRPLGLWLKGFGQGPDGELYVFGTRWLGPSGNTGRMLKIVPAPAPASFTEIATVNGGNAAVSWTGGAGPYALQAKTSLGKPLWQNLLVTNLPGAVVPQSGPDQFFRVIDAAHVPRIPLTGWATGQAENPTNSSTGTAFGIFALDGNTLTFNISYAGLSGPASAAHIHGPAPASGNASVLIDLSPYNGGGWSSNGTVSGVIVLTDSQKAMVLAGRTYFNFHTAAFSGGEIRGQIAPVNYEVVLDGSNEISPVSTPATGLGNLVLVGNQLTFNVTYQGLSGPANASHIHGPATTTQNAVVLTNLAAFNGGAYAASGSLSGTLVLTPTELAYLIDGQTYINFHTAAHSGGEIRGQIVPQVTAVPLTVLLSGLAERPALTNTAFGGGTLSLEGNRLAFNILYGGLSGPAINAHIHGPTDSTANAGVMVGLAPFNTGSFGVSGALSGVVTLTATQRDAVLNGQTYINFHTTANQGGELRGQIAPVMMTAGINGVNESPPVATTGAGSGTFALVRDQLSLVVTYRNLLSAATLSHIHGRAGLTGSAGVLINLAPYNGGGYGVSGSLSGTAPLVNIGNLLNVIDGQTYINFHTTNNPGGEIRGQLMR